MADLFEEDNQYELFRTIGIPFYRGPILDLRQVHELLRVDVRQPQRPSHRNGTGKFENIARNSVRFSAHRVLTLPPLFPGGVTRIRWMHGRCFCAWSTSAGSKQRYLQAPLVAGSHPFTAPSILPSLALSQPEAVGASDRTHQGPDALGAT